MYYVPGSVMRPTGFNTWAYSILLTFKDLPNSALNDNYFCMPMITPFVPWLRHGVSKV